MMSSALLLLVSALMARIDELENRDDPGETRIEPVDQDALGDALERLWSLVDGELDMSDASRELAELGMPESDIRLALSLGLQVVDFDETLAFSAGALRPATRAAGLSLGDRACLALAMQLDRPALTADRAWSRLRVGVEVEILRRSR